MTKALRITFLLYSITTLIFGLPLFLAPGRFLDLFGWQPVEPLLFRLLGAALLAMAWTSFRNFRAAEEDRVKMCLQGNLIFTGLGALGFARHLFSASWYPLMVWFIFWLLLVWAVVWATLIWLTRRKKA